MSKYKIEPWPPQPDIGMLVGTIPAGVKVTDTETGHWHCCNIYRSQHQNKDSAIKTLKALQVAGEQAMTTDKPRTLSQQPLLCPICGEGYLHDRQDTHSVDYRGYSGCITLYYAECDVCGSEQAGPLHTRDNKREMMEFKKQVDKAMEMGETNGN